MSTVFQGKFVSLFSLLFGAGIAYQAMRSDQRVGPGRTTLILFRRLIFLGFVGVLHGLLLWYGDILWFYASLGWILILARFLPANIVAFVGAGVLLVSVGCIAGMAALQALAPPIDESLSMPLWTDLTMPTNVEAFWKALAATNGSIVDPRWVPFEIATYRNGPAEVVFLLRGLQWITMLPVMYLVYGAHLIGMFLVGMAAARQGWFERSRIRLQWGVALVGIPLGLALSAINPTLLAMGATHQDPSVIAGNGATELGTTLLSLGYAGALCRLAYAGPQALSQFLASTGRMAFTVYLSMTVIMTATMYWWGFGYFGSIGFAAQFGVALLVWLGLASFAQAWLTTFAMGPLEWIWRAVTYWRLPSLKRRGHRDLTVGFERGANPRRSAEAG
jgi:uncharacterized protein